MFAKLVRFQNLDRSPVRRSKATGQPCNDNHPAGHAVAPSRRMTRPVLACRWQELPTGTFECVWYVERADAAAAEEPRAPGPSRQLSPLDAQSPTLVTLLCNVLQSVA